VSGVTTRGLRVVYDGRAVVDGVDLDVPRGGWLSIIGPNGAGKTTLLRCIAGIVPHRGSVTILGADGTRLRRRERARLVSLVPQQPELPVGMAVVDYVLLGRTPHLGWLGAERAEDLAVTRRVLAALDLTTLARRDVTTLSGGELQRVVLSRALAQEAPVLLLDEPTAALDVGRRQEILELVETLRRDRGLTVVSAMHDLTLAGQFSHRLLLLVRGRAVAEGDAHEVLTPQAIARHYGATVRVLDDDAGGVIVIPVRNGRERRGEEAVS